MYPSPSYLFPLPTNHIICYDIQNRQLIVKLQLTTSSLEIKSNPIRALKKSLHRYTTKIRDQLGTVAKTMLEMNEQMAKCIGSMRDEVEVVVLSQENAF